MTSSTPITNNISMTEKIRMLYNYAADNPEGFTKSLAVADLGWSAATFGIVVHQFRIASAETKLNLVCEPNGFQGEWNYRIVSTYEDAEPWLKNRHLDLTSRLRTEIAVTQTTVNVSRANSREGKRARMANTTYVYLLTQLENIE